MQKKSCLPTVLNVKAFTLIELLVVVLIIGILASVALPQYKKAVYKSRYAKLELLAKEYVQAAEVYHLAAGAWPSEFDELAISPMGTVATPTANDCRKVNDMYCCLGAAEGDYQMTQRPTAYVQARALLSVREMVTMFLRRPDIKL